MSDGIRVGVKDINWDELTRDSSTEDLLYIRGKIDQRLAQRPKRRILISKSEG
jgi:hypothetical protein